MHAASQAGRNKAAADYGLEKVAFNWGGMARGASKFLGAGSKMLGALPTGIGNVVAGGMGALGGFMGAKAEGHGTGTALLHAAGGATAGIPGGAGMAASMAAPMMLNKLVPPPRPAGVGQNITG